jgi:hypothetical protein
MLDRHVPPVLAAAHGNHSGHRSFYVRTQNLTFPMTTHELRGACGSSLPRRLGLVRFVLANRCDWRERLGSSKPAVLRRRCRWRKEVQWDVLSPAFARRAGAQTSGLRRPNKAWHRASHQQDQKPRQERRSALAVGFDRTGYICLFTRTYSRTRWGTGQTSSSLGTWTVPCVLLRAGSCSHDRQRPIPSPAASSMLLARASIRRHGEGEKFCRPLRR